MAPVVPIVMPACFAKVIFGFVPIAINTKSEGTSVLFVLTLFTLP